MQSHIAAAARPLHGFDRVGGDPSRPMELKAMRAVHFGQRIGEAHCHRAVSFLSWNPNLILAEIWLRRPTRPALPASSHRQLATI